MEIGPSLEEILTFLSLIFLSACFSASETAFFSLSKIRLKIMEEKKSFKENLILGLLSYPRRLLIVILAGNTFVNIGIAAMASSLALIASKKYGLSDSLCLTCGTVITTVLIVMFGEIAPKNYAYTHNERLAHIFSYPVYLIRLLLAPFLSLFIGLLDLFLRVFGMTKEKLNEPFLTHDEIELIFTSSEGHPILKSEEQNMIEQVFEFEEQSVREIMTPRHEMVCISKSAGFDDVMKIFREEGYSRFPVYQGGIDNIIGAVYVKDFLSFILKKGGSRQNFNLKELIHKVYFVPETKKVSDLFRDLKRKKLNLAVVVDEYGGTEGLVTMEDILEEVVGEIFDEYDEESDGIGVEKLSEGVYMVNGSTAISELEDVLEMADFFEEDGDVVSIGGLIFSQLGHIPSQGEEMTYKEVTFKVEKMDGNRIEKVKVCL